MILIEDLGAEKVYSINGLKIFKPYYFHVSRKETVLYFGAVWRNGTGLVLNFLWMKSFGEMSYDDTSIDIGRYQVRLCKNREKNPHTVRHTWHVSTAKKFSCAGIELFLVFFALKLVPFLVTLNICMHVIIILPVWHLRYVFGKVMRKRFKSCRAVKKSKHYCVPFPR